MQASKKIILLVSATLAASTIMAQDYARPEREQYAPSSRNSSSPSKKRFNIGLSIGAAIPFRDFASTYVKGSFWDFNSADSTHLQGFAQTGINFTVTASYIFPSNFGIMGMFGTSTNGFDISSFSTATGVQATSSAASFSEYEFLIGPCLSVPEGKLRLTANVLFGIAGISYPQVTYPINDSTTYSINFGGGSGFAYNIGGSLEYDITSGAAISLNVNYMSTIIQYNNYSIEANSPGYYPGYYTSPNYPIIMSAGILKVTVGVVFRF